MEFNKNDWCEQAAFNCLRLSKSNNKSKIMYRFIHLDTLGWSGTIEKKRELKITQTVKCGITRFRNYNLKFVTGVT